MSGSLRNRILALTVAAAAPVIGVSLWSIHRTAVELSDPCARWAATQLAGSIGPRDSCRSITVHYQSKARAALVAGLVPGGVLAAAILAVAGAALSRRRAMLAGAIGMLAETLVVFTIAPLTLAAGLAFLLLARRVGNVS